MTIKFSRHAQEERKRRGIPLILVDCVLLQFLGRFVASLLRYFPAWKTDIGLDFVVIFRLCPGVDFTSFFGISSLNRRITWAIISLRRNT